mmetsp:Transcript_7201/g.17399  ORF Transcript_7201/g.17399 Transcript_7201/m.17399 type:complete len:209 (-) Transcript_7201:173-799(-)
MQRGQVPHLADVIVPARHQLSAPDAIVDHKHARHGGAVCPLDDPRGKRAAPPPLLVLLLLLLCHRPWLSHSGCRRRHVFLCGSFPLVFNLPARCCSSAGPRRNGFVRISPRLIVIGRRSLWRGRGGSFAFALWFLLGLGTPVGLHSVPRLRRPPPPCLRVGGHCRPRHILLFLLLLLLLGLLGLLLLGGCGGLRVAGCFVRLRQLLEL